MRAGRVPIDSTKDMEIRFLTFDKDGNPEYEPLAVEINLSSETGNRTVCFSV